MKKSLMKESVMFITGRREKLTLNGPKKLAESFVKVLVASKKLYEGLNDPKIKLVEIERLVEAKNFSAKKYKEETGKTWPL